MGKSSEGAGRAQGGSCDNEQSEGDRGSRDPQTLVGSWRWDEPGTHSPQGQQSRVVRGPGGKELDREPEWTVRVGCAE